MINCVSKKGEERRILVSYITLNSDRTTSNRLLDIKYIFSLLLIIWKKGYNKYSNIIRLLTKLKQISKKKANRKEDILDSSLIKCLYIENLLIFFLLLKNTTY